MRLWSQLGFQRGRARSIEIRDCFHDYAMRILVFITGFILVRLWVGVIRDYFMGGVEERDVVEVIWTVLPCGVLVRLVIPRLIILYQREEVCSPSVRLRVIGHQWYWEYSYPEIRDARWDSYMVRGDRLKFRDIRNREVDRRCWLPWREVTRIMVSRVDVLHAWTVNSLGVKIDAIPGRLNQIVTKPIKIGVYYGQCSELCGVNHRFIPIVVEVGMV